MIGEGSGECHIAVVDDSKNTSKGICDCLVSRISRNNMNEVTNPKILKPHNLRVKRLCKDLAIKAYSNLWTNMRQR